MSELTEYETICVLVPELQGEQLTKLDEKIKKVFTSHKVKEVTKKDLGQRKLAYSIKRNKTGHYFQYIYKAPSDLVKDLEKNLGYEESVLRYITIKYDKYNKKDILMEPAGFEISSF